MIRIQLLRTDGRDDFEIISMNLCDTDFFLYGSISRRRPLKPDAGFDFLPNCRRKMPRELVFGASA